MQKQNSVSQIPNFVILGVFLVVLAVLPTQAHAEFFDTYTPASGGDTNLGYGILDSGNFYDTYTPSSGGFYDTYTPSSGSYYDTYTPSSGNYYDTYTPSYNSYGTYGSSPYGYSPSYGYTSGSSYTPTSSYGTNGYTSGSSYTPTYGSGATYGSSYMPSYSSQGAYYSSPAPVGTASAPHVTQSQGQSQGQSSYNSNPNTNTNSNYTPSYSTSSTGPVTTTSTNTNTNTPIANASTGPITNTNNASTGPININNVVNVAPASQAQPQYNVQYTLPRPSCTINASSYYTYGGYNNYNQPITLTWSSSNATSAYITPSVGSVAPSGSQTVYPSGYTTYTLTISGPGGTATCQATANYGYNYVAPIPPTYVPPTVYQPASPSVSLTQIPYTGYDFGLVGNAIYWMTLLAFAVAAGYLMVYYRGGAFALATSFISRGSAKNDSYETVETDGASDAIVESVIAPEVSTQEETKFVLPTIAANRMTVDSMIIDTSATGAPRIVIARN